MIVRQRTSENQEKCRKCGADRARSAIRTEVTTTYAPDGGRLWMGGIREPVKLCTLCSIKLAGWILEARR
jgi:hypothetical protein